MIARRSYGAGRSGTSRWVENSRQQPSSGISAVPRSLSNSNDVSVTSVDSCPNPRDDRARLYSNSPRSITFSTDRLLWPENNRFVNVASVARKSGFFSSGVSSKRLMDWDDIAVNCMEKEA